MVRLRIRKREKSKKRSSSFQVITHILHLTFSFSAFWFALDGSDSDAIAALVASSIIYTQRYLDKRGHGDIIIDSFGTFHVILIFLFLFNILIILIVWDGEASMQSVILFSSSLIVSYLITYSFRKFVKDFGGTTKEEEGKVFIPLIDRYLFFMNDIGHLLKALRSYSLFFFLISISIFRKRLLEV